MEVQHMFPAGTITHVRNKFEKLPDNGTWATNKATFYSRFFLIKQSWQ